MPRPGCPTGDAFPGPGLGAAAARAAGRRWIGLAFILAGALVPAGARSSADARSPAAIQPPARPQTDAQDKRAAARIASLQREADDLASRERTLVEELRRLEVDRDLRAAELGQRTRELQDIEAALDATAARITALEQTARSQLPDLSARMTEIYKLGNGGYLRLLLNLDDLRSMGRAYRFVSGLQGMDRRRVAEHQRTLDALRKAQASLEEKRVEARQARDLVGRASQAAAQAVSAREELIRRIDARRDLAAQLVGELASARQALQRTLDEAARGAPPPGAAATAALPLRPFKGDLDWPVDGKVSGTFGRQIDPRFHTATVSNGVRIAGAVFTPVSAIHEGTVVFASPFAGFGKLVILDHGAMAFSLYGYLADIDVTSGEHVSRGQVLGSVGEGLGGDPGLYFELRIDGKPADPLQWLRPK
jgi:murein hydrolase activator